MTNRPDQALIDERAGLVDARVRTEVAPLDEMTSAQRRANSAAWDAQDAFDRTHPEVKAWIDAEHAASARTTHGDWL